MHATFVLQLFFNIFTNILYEIIRCIEIIIHVHKFSYHTLYQAETPVSARGPIGLIRESRADVGVKG